MLDKNLQFSFALTALAISSPVFAVDYFTESQAQRLLIPDADAFVKKEVQLSDQQIDKIKELSGMRQRNSKPNVWEARKKGKLIGYFYKDDVVGKHEFITYGVATTPDGVVLGIEVMSYRETHGGEIKEAKWKSHFKGKKLSDPFKLDVDVPNITGATLSSRNVLDGVKRLLALQTLLK